MKTNFTDEQLQKIIELFNQKLGSRKIAKIMQVNRSTIIRAYKQLKLNSSVVKRPRFTHLITEKKCKICKNNKLINQFRKRIKNDRLAYEPYCLICEKELNQKSSLKRYQLDKSWYKQYRLNNLDKIRKYQKQYNLQYYKNRVKKDPEFKIRCSMSTAIYVGLKNHNSSKNGSCWKQLSYTPLKLKQYLESKFESWMTWENHGLYNFKTWDDNNKKTWTWQIDHIIPHSMFRYTSMEDEGFKKCWALENLRPLSAKQNLLDGVTKIRHKII